MKAFLYTHIDEIVIRMLWGILVKIIHLNISVLQITIKFENMNVNFNKAHAVSSLVPERSFTSSYLHQNINELIPKQHK